MVFIVGGIAPLLLLVPMALWQLPDIRSQRADPETMGAFASLFTHGRGTDTLALWAASFCALLVLYLLLNWLPVLLEGRGTARGGALMIVQIGFTAASRFSRQAMDGMDQRAVTIAMSLGFVASLAMVAGRPWFQSGRLSRRHSALPTCAEPQSVWVVADGRLGSVSGPHLAGGFIAAGSSSTQELAGIIPVGIVGALAIYFLAVRRHRQTPTLRA